MTQERIDRILDLVLMLSGDGHTVEELSETFGVSKRLCYYMLTCLRQHGFIVIKQGKVYRLNPKSPFFQQVSANISFSEDEAAFLYKLVDNVEDSGRYGELVKNKLVRFYDIDYLCGGKASKTRAQMINNLYDAIDRKRVVVLKNYSSPHSKTVSDRVVEPFLFMNDKCDVRCFEVSSGTNKTFKLSRMQDVELLDLIWEHEDAHKQMLTDVFMFSGDEQQTITLRLGRLSASILREEYPKSERYIEQQDDDHWIAKMPVCSFIGVGRFVLGLFEDIEVLECKEFKTFIKDKINKLNAKQL
jgi:predicted DNA-binding transcriptional regulator YafY